MSKIFARVLFMVIAMALVFSAPALAQNGGGSDDDVIDDDSINNSGNTTEAQYQNQDCDVIVQQYNNAISGDAVATGNDAVAATAAEVNAPINVVQNCIQAGGDVNIGANADDEQYDDDDPDPEPPSDNNRSNNDDDAADRSQDVIAATVPEKVLANTGGVSPLLPVGAMLTLAGLVGFGLIRRR